MSDDNGNNSNNNGSNLNDDEELAALIDEFNELLASIFRGLNELTEDEQIIVDRIQYVLDDNDIDYEIDKWNPGRIIIDYRDTYGEDEDTKEGSVEIVILVQHDRVTAELSFPFKVRADAVPIMSMHLFWLRIDGQIGNWCVDPAFGVVGMEYVYAVGDADDFDEELFWKCVSSMIDEAYKSYNNISKAAQGIVPESEKKNYIALLERTIKRINGDGQEDLGYGTAALRKLLDNAGEDGEVKPHQNEDDE